MDNGTLFIIILLTTSISTIIDFLSAVSSDTEADNTRATTAVAIGVIFKVMILLFVVLPIMSYGGAK